MEHAQRIRQEFVNDRRYYVLILILMEHAQRDMYEEVLIFRSCCVLILILMEHAQRVPTLLILRLLLKVLILIFMEHAQRERTL